MTRKLAVTFDYRCPFAYNGHASVIAAVRGGADIEARPHAFSLDQIHVPEGEAPVWERDPSERGTGVLALLYGISVRDHFPEQFVDAHLALFAARHEHAKKLGKEDVLREAVASAGVDPDAVADHVHGGESLATLAKEHTQAVDRWGVFGVPTFIEGENAAFVRFMERDRADDVERVLDLLDWVGLNEFKRPTVPN
ncbi:MAG: DsbA family protein [Acidimicrobiia bacterium]